MAGENSVAKVENVNDATLAVFGKRQLEAKSPFHALKVAMKDYCLVKSTSFDEPTDRNGLETGSARHQNISLVLANPTQNTRRARGRASSAHDVFCKRKSSML